MIAHRLDWDGFAGVPLPEIVRSMHRDQLGTEAPDEFVETFLAAKQAWEESMKRGTPEYILKKSNREKMRAAGYFSD